MGEAKGRDRRSPCRTRNGGYLPTLWHHPRTAAADQAEGRARTEGAHRMSVVSLAAHREANSPHLSGEAKCAKCGREWVAVCPVGTVWLECPGCGSECGVMRGPVTEGRLS